MDRAACTLRQCLGGGSARLHAVALVHRGTRQLYTLGQIFLVEAQAQTYWSKCVVFHMGPFRPLLSRSRLAG